MSYRYMRMIIFFDLPTDTCKERKDYRKFRKLLINEGFIMMQESVYSKLALNMSVVSSISNKIKLGKPKSGLIQMLVITEAQFANVETIVGDSSNIEVDTTQRLVII